MEFFKFCENVKLLQCCGSFVQFFVSVFLPTRYRSRWHHLGSAKYDFIPVRHAGCKHQFPSTATVIQKMGI